MCRLYAGKWVSGLGWSCRAKQFPFILLWKAFGVGQAVAFALALAVPVPCHLNLFVSLWPEGPSLVPGGPPRCASFTKVKSANFHNFFPTVFSGTAEYPTGSVSVLFFYFLYFFFGALVQPLGDSVLHSLAGAPIMIVWQILMMPLGLMKLLLVQQTRKPPFGRIMALNWMGVGWRLVEDGWCGFWIEYAHDVRSAGSFCTFIPHCFCTEKIMGDFWEFMTLIYIFHVILFNFDPKVRS